MNLPRNRSKNNIQGWRVSTFLIGIAIILLAYTARLFNLQILQLEDWQAQSQDNHTERISISTHRGVILDRNGIVLARNIASYSIAVTPALLPDDEGDIEEILRELAEYSTRPLHYDDDPEAPDILIQCGENLGITEMVNVGLTFAPFEPVLVECDIDRDRALAIMEKSNMWPGVSIEIDPVRDYPTGDLTATFIGYLGPIPATYEEILRDQGFIPGRDKIGYG